MQGENSCIHQINRFTRIIAEKRRGWQVRFLPSTKMANQLYKLWLIICAVETHAGNQGLNSLGAELTAGAVVKLFNRFFNGYSASV
jgi:hypothetical protein